MNSTTLFIGAGVNFVIALISKAFGDTDWVNVSATVSLILLWLGVSTKK